MVRKSLKTAELDIAESKLRKLLLALADQVRKIETNTLEPSGDPQGQTADESIEDAAFERDRETLAAENHVTTEVHDALLRLAMGRYGLCESCDRPIERRRLTLLPYARACAACARRAEAASSR